MSNSEYTSKMARLSHDMSRHSRSRHLEFSRTPPLCFGEFPRALHDGAYQERIGQGVDDLRFDAGSKLL